jgi:hypothetical protein
MQITNLVYMNRVILLALLSVRYPLTYTAKVHTKPDEAPWQHRFEFHAVR